jgi:hypothetical protein
LEDNEHSDWPKAVRTERKIEEVATLVRANHSQLVDDIAALGISHGMCRRVLFDALNMSCVPEYCVPCVLMQDQRDDHMTIYCNLISIADEDETFLKRIITGDDTWCFLYDPQLK